MGPFSFKPSHAPIFILVILKRMSFMLHFFILLIVTFSSDKMYLYIIGYICNNYHLLTEYSVGPEWREAKWKIAIKELAQHGGYSSRAT